MHAVAEIPNPGLQAGRVVLLNGLAIGFDARVAGERGPVAGGGDEGDVYAGVRGQVVGFTRFGVGVKEEV